MIRHKNPNAETFSDINYLVTLSLGNFEVMKVSKERPQKPKGDNTLLPDTKEGKGGTALAWTLRHRHGGPRI